jgi:hypothetical protein
MKCRSSDVKNLIGWLAPMFVPDVSSPTHAQALRTCEAAYPRPRATVDIVQAAQPILAGPALRLALSESWTSARKERKGMFRREAAAETQLQLKCED